MTLKPRLEKTQRSLRDLEDDVARIYHQKQKEAETQHREFEKERLQLLEKLQQVEQTKKSKKLELYQNQEEMDKETTKETTKVMDKFLESCEQWPSKLNKLSVDLTGKAEDLEREEVENVTKWLESDAATCMKSMAKWQQETEEFEAVERQLMDDRVVELETQLAQKRAVEREKEMELPSLRADQDELLRSSHAVPKEEWDTLVSVKEAMTTELLTLNEQLKQQSEQFVRVSEERDGLNEQNHKLQEEVKRLREVTEQSILQKKEFAKLNAQL
ncbi:hypothetical protein JM18_004419 [Phytophthora kernoviae]|uniref:Uncharacterized protein n=1 Tax=Phytophthora kernoviae TaxID=325452 RepID=A0A8T0LWT8_9STRA|nr:hypothetical protein JM16_004806 [Phytophthora kernoviae]KAG2525374.1 hypothetical protein JM18_004419 [Phytophthora kernoviae]